MDTQDYHPVGRVALAVLDLERQRRFYQEVIGLSPLDGEEAGGPVTLGAGGVPLVRLEPGASARRPTQAPGLYHLAIRLPDRLELARAVVRLAERGGDIQGVGDHGVSEAVYLSDPERNGIEIYADRPEDDWPVDDDGRIAMFTDPLDLENLLGELKGQLQAEPLLPAGTVMGHIHLSVSNLEEARQFYQDVVGLNLIQQYGESALFLARGDYHHHVGMNIWQSAGSPPPPDGSSGLRWFELLLPAEERQSVLLRAKDAGYAVEEHPAGALLRDPSGNGVLLGAG